MSIREIFDSVSVSVIQFLESHQGVTNVQFYELGGANASLIQDWEIKNKNALPADLKAFLQISNGLLLKWQIKLQPNGGDISLGNMYIHPLDKIKPISISSSEFEMVIQPNTKIKEEVKSVFSDAFELDDTSGKVALVYLAKKGYGTPECQVWFQDLCKYNFDLIDILGLQWHFIAPNFTQYFRLLIMHLGLPNWHMAFTDFGLDPIAKQWFRFLSPERLAIDLKSNVTLSQPKKRRRKKKKAKKKEEGAEGEEASKRKRKTKHVLNMKKVNEILQQ
jgi:tubulin polyglutamylase complex subunit 2